MTPKERAAMQQALEALEEMFHSNSTKVAVEKYNIAHTALREALAEPQVDWYEEAMRLAGLNAKHVGELRKLEAEQTEQEQVADKVLRLLEPFIPQDAALVAAHEREKLMNVAIFSKWYQELDAAVLAEREACAKVCETDELCCKCGDECAAAIRARGEK